MIVEVLGAGGAPCALEQVHDCFMAVVQNDTCDKGRAKVRLIIDQGEPKAGVS